MSLVSQIRASAEYRTRRAAEVDHELVLARADLALARSNATHSRELVDAAIDDYELAVDREIAAIRKMHSLLAERVRIAVHREGRALRMRERLGDGRPRA